MADMFLSYSSEDRARVAPLAKALEAAGFSLWWDKGIAPGADFAETIHREIEAAKAVIVCWTPAAARSQWVRDEATVGRRKGILLPLLLEGDEPPMGFRQVQAIDFRDWRGDETGQAFQALCASVTGILGRAPLPAAAPSFSTRTKSLLRRRRNIILATAGAAVLAAVAAIALPERGPQAASVVEGRIALGDITAVGDDAEAIDFAERLGAAFRSELAGFHIETVADGGDPASAEFSISTNIAREGDHLVVASALDDRKTGATVWSLTRPAQSTPGVEAQAVARVLQCALGHRSRGSPADLFLPVLRFCGKIVFADFAGAAVERGNICDAGERSLYARALCISDETGEILNIPFGPDRDRAIAAARLKIEGALKADPNSAALLGAMAFTHMAEGRWTERANWLERAMAADPDLPGIRNGYSVMLADMGRMRESEEEALKQFSTTPVWTAALRVARLIAANGDWPKAREIYARVRRIEPIQADQHELMTLAWYGDPTEAEAALADRTGQLGASPADVSCMRMIIAARRGELIDTREMRETCKRNASFAPRNLMISGEVDGALAAIEKQIERPDFGAPQLFYPEMRPLWGDDRFWRIVAKMGLTDYWMNSGRWPDFCAEEDLPFNCAEKAAAAMKGQSASAGVATDG